MAVPAGIPLMLVFTGIFVFLVLFIACIVLSIIVKDTMIRAGLVMGAFMLVLVMGGGAYMTMVDVEEPAKQAEADVYKPKKEAAKPQKKPKPAAAPEAYQGYIHIRLNRIVTCPAFHHINMVRPSGSFIISSENSVELIPLLDGFKFSHFDFSFHSNASRLSLNAT